MLSLRLRAYPAFHSIYNFLQTTLYHLLFLVNNTFFSFVFDLSRLLRSAWYESLGANERVDERGGGGARNSLHGSVDDLVACPQALQGHDGGRLRQAQGKVEHPRRRELLLALLLTFLPLLLFLPFVVMLLLFCWVTMGVNGCHVITPGVYT